MARTRTTAHILAMALPVFLAGLPCAAASSDDAAAKAEHLLNFLKFVEWPSAADTQPFAVCFLGGQKVSEAFAVNVSTKHVRLHPLTVRPLMDAHEIDSCSVLFVGADYRAANPIAHEPLRKQMLTVSDAPSFGDRGGMIEMNGVGDHFRFTVNAENVRDAGLRMDSNLLEIGARRF